MIRFTINPITWPYMIIIYINSQLAGKARIAQNYKRGKQSSIKVQKGLEILLQMEIANQTRKCRKVGPYVLLRQIGKGSYSTVWEATSAGERYAVKQISLVNLPQKNLQRIKQELGLLQLMKHPNIVSFLDFKQTAHNLYLVFQHCRHTDLNEYIKKHYQGTLPEEQVRRILLQLKNAFKVIRQHKVVHRDLKLQNILVTQDFEIKLADFGFAKLLENNQYFSSFVGTPLTMAPQVFNKQKYNQKCDIWSLGVITYQMLFGRSPFFHKEKISRQEIKESYNKGIKFQKQISPLAQDFIKRALVVDPEKRMDFPEFFQHPWLKEDQGCFSDLLREQALKTEISQSLTKSKKFTSQRQFIIKNSQQIFAFTLINFIREYIENSLKTCLDLAHKIIEIKYHNSRLTFLALAVILENVDQARNRQREIILNGEAATTLPQYINLRELQSWPMTVEIAHLPSFLDKRKLLVSQHLNQLKKLDFSKQEGEVPLWSLFFAELKSQASKQPLDNIRSFLKVKAWQGSNISINVASTILSSKVLDILIRKINLKVQYTQLHKKCSPIFKLAVINQPSPLELELQKLRMKLMNDSQEQ